MSFQDLMLLVPDKVLTKDKQYVELYNEALKMLNAIKLSRHKALYFGTMQIGPDTYYWDGKKVSDFTQRYFSCCLYIMDNLYNKLKDKPQELVEVSLSILYAMLTLFVNTREYKVDETLIEENNKYVKDDELKEEFE